MKNNNGQEQAAICNTAKTDKKEHCVDVPARAHYNTNSAVIRELRTYVCIIQSNSSR
jgi:hypothetical protein